MVAGGSSVYHGSLTMGVARVVGGWAAWFGGGWGGLGSRRLRGLPRVPRAVGESVRLRLDLEALLRAGARPR
jgi:hypothetical protein